MRCGGERWEPGGGRAWGVVAAHKRHAREFMARLKAWGPRARAESAHLELEVLGRDAGGVEAQRLVEGRRLPSRREGMRCGGGGASWKAGGPGVVVAAHKRHARGKGPAEGLWAKGTRGAHVEHVAHVRDAGGVKAQRLVEGVRALPSRREGMRCAGGRGVREPGGGRACGVVARHTRGMHGEKARLKAWGPRARAERTPNM
jgi:hypothetical protein